MNTIKGIKREFCVRSKILPVSEWDSRLFNAATVSLREISYIPSVDILHPLGTLLCQWKQNTQTALGITLCIQPHIRESSTNTKIGHQKMKPLYEKPIANIIVSDEKLKAFLLRLGARWQCLLLPLLFNILLEILARAIRQDK